MAKANNVVAMCILPASLGLNCFPIFSSVTDNLLPEKNCQGKQDANLAKIEISQAHLELLSIQMF